MTPLLIGLGYFSVGTILARKVYGYWLYYYGASFRSTSHTSQSKGYAFITFLLWPLTLLAVWFKMLWSVSGALPTVGPEHRERKIIKAQKKAEAESKLARLKAERERYALSENYLEDLEG